MDCRLISYTDSGNIGDAIQTVALQRYIEAKGFKCNGYLSRGALNNWIVFDKNQETAIVNGWHRNSYHTLPSRAIFVGLHAGEEQIKNIDKDITIGCRDLYTWGIAKSLGYKAVLTGCATSSLFVKIVADSRSERRIVKIDYPHTGHGECELTQVINPKMPWLTQIGTALERLNTYIQCNKIITSRLHVFLPCIAMGVNVELNYSSTSSPERFDVMENLYLVTGKLDYNKDIHQQQLDSLKLREQWENGFAEVISDWKG